jgi:hypothetical protein
MKNLFTIVSLFLLIKTFGQTEFETINTPQVSNIISYDINFRAQMLAYDKETEFRYSYNGGFDWKKANIPSLNLDPADREKTLIKSHPNGDFLIFNPEIGALDFYHPVQDTISKIVLNNLGTINDFEVQGNGRILVENADAQIWYSDDLGHSFQLLFDLKAYLPTAILYDFIAADPDRSIYHLHIYGRNGKLQILVVGDDLPSPVEAIDYQSNVRYFENNIIKHPSGAFVFASPGGRVYSSPDGIHDWEEIETPDAGFNYGFAIFQSGDMLLITQEGPYTKELFPSDWVKVSYKMIDPKFFLRNLNLKHHPYEDILYLNIKTGDGSCLQYTDRRFRTWHNFKTVSDNYDTRYIKKGPGGKIYAFVESGCYVSSNHGTNWSQLTIEDTLAVYDIEFNPNGFTYATTSNNSFYLLPPGSTVWREYRPPGINFYHTLNPQIFLGKNGLLIYSWAAGVFVSKDNGFNWKDIHNVANLSDNDLVFDLNDDFYISYAGNLRRYFANGDSTEIVYKTANRFPIFISKDGTRVFPAGKEDSTSFISRIYPQGADTFFLGNGENSQISLTRDFIGFANTEDGLFAYKSFFEHPQLVAEPDGINSFLLEDNYFIYLACKGSKIKRSKNRVDIKRHLLDVSLWYDKDGDCQVGPNDELMKDFPLKITSQMGTIYRHTNTNGKITFLHEDCTIEKVDEFNMWNACELPIDVEFLSRFDTAKIDILLNANPPCPFLWTSMGTPFFNLCDEVNYWISYSNRGIAKSENTNLEITLDPQLEFIESEIPLTPLGNNVFQLQIGEMEPNTHEQFKIKVRTPCDPELLESAFCSQVDIFPKGDCLPHEKYSGPYLTASSQCLGDSVEFTITNEGQEDMVESNHYLWMSIEEQNKAKKSPAFKLKKDESLSFKIPAEGQTYRVEVYQPEQAFNKYAVSTIEGCGTGKESMGWYNAFGHQEDQPDFDLDCRILKEKQEPEALFLNVEPSGADDFFLDTIIPNFHDSVVPNNTAIEVEFIFINKSQEEITAVEFDYHIHYKLFHGLPKTYQFNLSNYEPTSGFIWNNLALKPYSEDPENSYLYVKFSPFIGVDLGGGQSIYPWIRERRSWLEKGYKIFTRSGYYDFLNTNDMSSPELTYVIAPNPMFESTRIELEGEHLIGKEFDFHLFNMAGQPVSISKFRGSKFYLSRNGLPSGMYFFRISQEGRALAMGQIVMQ